MTSGFSAAGPTDDDLEAARSVLFEVYGLKQFRDTRYLDWFYRKNPVGPAIVINYFVDGECIAHMAGIPQRYACGDKVMPFVFPINIAVSEKARGQGMMTKMCQATFDAALEWFGDGAVVGMPNAASTHGFVRKLDCRLVQPLPVHVMTPVWPGSRHVESIAVDENFLAGYDLERLAGDLDHAASTEGWSRVWDYALLHWRLSCPGVRYAVHANQDLFAVTTTTVEKGVPFTVVLKTLPRGHRRNVIANSLVAAACQFHRTPVAIHAGFSHAARFVGPTLPERFKPAPLNLIFRSLRPGYVDDASFRYSAMEFLEFDAY